LLGLKQHPTWDEIRSGPAVRTGRLAPRRRAWRASPGALRQAGLVLVAGMLLATAGWVALQSAIATTGVELARARAELARARRVGQELRLELAALRSVERIEAVAVGKLGFSKPAAVRMPATPDLPDIPAVTTASRTVTLRLEDGPAAAPVAEEPRLLMVAWDRFLRWLAGQRAEAGSWD